MKLSDHFSRAEFACKCGCGFDTVDAELIRVLEEIRCMFKATVIVNSGCRCAAYNEQIGGSKNSQHVLGRAADIIVGGHSNLRVQDYIDGVYPEMYGLGRYDTFTHIDTRNQKARW